MGFAGRPVRRDGQPVALILETQADHARDLGRFLAHESYAPVGMTDPRSLLRAIGLAPPALVVVGSVKGDAEGSLAAIRAVREDGHRMPVILVVDQGSEALAVAALRAGASDYVDRREMPGGLRESLARVLRDPATKEVRVEAGEERRLAGGRRLVGESSWMKSLRRRIRRFGDADCNLLVTGETGTGKDLVAELVHANSPRNRRPFVCVNCAAIPDDLLENELFGHERGAFTGADHRQEGRVLAANGGTLFLDEIGDLSVHTQAKFLRAIERKEVQRLGSGQSIPVDIRIVAATNRDIDMLVEDGGFRQDLYFRLDVARVDLPPLRERREDLYPLCAHYLAELNQRFDLDVEGFTPEASRLLFWYSWPGNVRELKNVLEATLVNGATRRIGVGDLPESFLRRSSDRRNMPAEERDKVLWALYSCRWNKSQAARKLHWSRMTLYRKIDQYRIVQAGAKSAVDNLI